MSNCVSFITMSIKTVSIIFKRKDFDVLLTVRKAAKHLDLSVTR